MRQTQIHSALGAVVLGAVVLGAVVLGVTAAGAQTFTSGSNGTDGALDLSNASGIVLFDPTTFDPPLDTTGDNVYHFTTIDIPSGVTVTLSADVLGVRPVVWLASGAVTIGGNLNLRGEPGRPGTNLTPVAAGAGGYGGGTAGSEFADPLPGHGLGGGGVTSGAGGHAGHTLAGTGGGGGPIYGNPFLVPLQGGSGGGGGAVNSDGPGGGGGTGGGAILIASSESITMTGTIVADGGVGASGPGHSGGSGSGGSIRLRAPRITTGARSTLSAMGGAGASRGRIRIEARDRILPGTARPTPVVTTAPAHVFPTSTWPWVRVTRVDGRRVRSVPTGSLLDPDVVIFSVDTTKIDFAIEAHNVPLGTAVLLTFYSEGNPPQKVSSTALTGTLNSSTATAVVNVPVGVSRFHVQASWTP